jgi:hypothetical protein
VGDRRLPRLISSIIRIRNSNSKFLTSFETVVMRVHSSVLISDVLTNE